MWKVIEGGEIEGRDGVGIYGDLSRHFMGHISF